MAEADCGRPPLRLTVTQVRVAASCPRIAYFDAVETRRRGLRQPHVTRIWKTAETEREYGLGALFHQSVEGFQTAARLNDAVDRLLEADADATELSRRLLLQIYRSHVNRDRLFAATGDQQQAFMRALQHYTSELAEILLHGRSTGVSLTEIREQLFGDQRRQVDVTFAVGPDNTAVNIHGRLDYVFYDWRSTRRRIIDYKLTPAHEPGNDLFQVSLYALMHHVQHGTQPDAAVLYLHPERVLEQRTWEQLHTERQHIYDFLASLQAWLRYDEATRHGLKPPGEPIYCASCAWQNECTARLGPKSEGAWLTLWRDAARETIETEPDRPSPEPRMTATPVPPPRSGASGTASDPPLPGRGENADELPREAEAGDGLCVGYWQSDGAQVRIPPTALATHTLVAGAAGSGKTWLAKVLLEEAIRSQAAVIAVDPQGDLVQMLQRSDCSELEPDQRSAYHEFADRVDVRIWTPGSSLAERLSLDPLRLPRDEDLAGIQDLQRRQEELEHLLLTSAASLVDLARAGGETDSQQTLVLEILRRLTQRDHGRVSLQHLADALHEPESCGLETPDRLLRKVDRERLARKLGNFLLGPNAALFGEGTSLDLDTFLTTAHTATDRASRSPLNVIYLNHLVDDDQKQFVVAVLATEIYRWMITRPPDTGPFVLFYLDEARDFLPAGNRQTAAKQPLRRLFSQGRKYRVGCMVAAQSPRSVEYEAISNCSTKLIGRLESQQDVDRVREWFSREGRAPQWLADRKGAEAGSFLGRWPEMPEMREGQSFRSRQLYSYHSGAWSPDRLEAELARHDE